MCSCRFTFRHEGFLHRCGSVAGVSSRGSSSKLRADDRQFRLQYGKVYNGIDDESVHFAHFKANVEIIVATNAKNLTFSMGVNRFADRTPDEFAAMYTGLKPVSLWSGLPRLGSFEYDGADFPSSVDWTTQGVVTTGFLRRSFSSTGALEWAWALSTGKLVSPSEQQFVDCDATDWGCNGGWMDYTFAFAEKNAICTEGEVILTRSGRIYGRVHWQSQRLGIGIGAATRVHRHRGRPVLFSIVLVWRPHLFMRLEARSCCPCCRLRKRGGYRLLEGEDLVGNIML